MLDRDSVVLKKKLAWEPGRRIYPTLVARVYYEHGVTTSTGLRETDLDPIQAWCTENQCGVRISFDEFKFKDGEEISLFLLRWG
jgi:hypothetical protein